MILQDKYNEVRSRSPFPWRDEIHPMGLVKIFDARNQEVLLFDIIAIAVISTMNPQQVKEAA